MAIFVSSQAVDEAPATMLVAELLRAGLVVEHSPRNEDAAWSEWYGGGLSAAVARCSVFVAVIDRGWDSSTWMAIEADEAVQKLGSARIRSFFWNPERLKVTAKGMLPYLKEELPRELSEVIAQLKRADAGTDAR
jgi:hypothetical protein